VGLRRVVRLAVESEPPSAGAGGRAAGGIRIAVRRQARPRGTIFDEYSKWRASGASLASLARAVHGDHTRRVLYEEPACGRAVERRINPSFDSARRTSSLACRLAVCGVWGECVGGAELYNT
jgi:hypothetical protein